MIYTWLNKPHVVVYKIQLYGILIHMSQHFTHLHLHTDYSLLDGAITIDKLVQFGVEQKLKALAITDHGNIFGAVKFFQKCKKSGIKPILGMEAYLATDALVKEVHNKYYHLLILVENEIGYKNLCKLISFSYQTGFYFKPRIDYSQLKQYSEGLIITSGCLGGHIPQLLMKDQAQQAEEIMDWFLGVFGEERFFLEVQPEDQQEQAVLNKHLYQWSTKKGIPLVATGDCHYATQEDHKAHEVMLSIQTRGLLSDQSRYTFGDCRVFMRTPQEMLDAFKGHEDAVWTSGAIADRCTFDFPTGKFFFPQFPIPEIHTPESYFTHLCKDGLQRLIDTNRISNEQIHVYQNRLDQEIELILSMGFIEYFLVVSDFIQWARNQGIPVGPGRGSAAGSLIAWSLQITNIDPLKYNLLFERFLNPERISMPDIDIDFCIEGREKVIQYVRDKYGHENVCQIITFGTMLAKGVIKDVARVLGFSFEDSNALTSLVPDQLKITLKEALEQEPRLKQMMTNNPKVKELFDLAFRLEGVTRHASKHAAGIVISPQPVDQVLPVYVPPKSTELVTQYAMTELEYLGFLKIDLLGLKNLTLIDRVVQLISTIHGITIDIDALPLDDPPTFQLLAEAATSGVFQLESSGIKEVLQKLQPEKIEDIIAVNALYRPGPLGSGMVDDFIERKHGRQKITYIFDELEPILEETYGVIVYQEQVMKIAATIAGYSLGEADILRRAMGKKKIEVMKEQRKLFLQRSQDRKFNVKKVGELFDLMAYFAGYGFNKSHSAAYAMIAYQTAYLKAHYPAEFMASLISLEVHNAEKMAFYLQEAKAMGITLLPPNINTSHIMFSVIKGDIVFGLQGIKGVGHAALESIIQERAKQKFTDILDFCIRIDLRTVNKRVLEHLIVAGAFDSLPGSRAQKIDELSAIMNQAADIKRSLKTGQMGLFEKKQNASVNHHYVFESSEKWSDKQILEKEKEVLGFYLSAHPIEGYSHYTMHCNITTFTDALKQSSATGKESVVVCCGVLTQRKDIFTKKGDRMSFIQLEDLTSTAEVILFPKLFKKTESYLDTYSAFIIKGTLDAHSTQVCKIKADTFVPLERMFDEWDFKGAICMLPDDMAEQHVTTLNSYLTVGRTPLILRWKEQNKRFELNTKKKIACTQELINSLKELKITMTLLL
jgi:DNA polymerase III subunit alpha